jgi:hypothetical protein
MRRLQLLEFEDLDWFPAVIRNGATACLRAIGKLGKMGHFMAPALARALEASGERQLIDLCSGGAGPLPEVLQALQQQGLQPTVLLTDKFPNQVALAQAVAECPGSEIAFYPLSVDATNVPPELTGFRTLFNAFHHFPPQLAQGILADAVRKQVPIGIFEVVERSPWALLSVIVSPLLVLFLMPGIRPLQPLWWLFTYPLPLIPALLLWDGLVSCLRVYSPAELRELIAGIENHESFDWQITRVWMPPLPLRSQILIGIPKRFAHE